MTATLQVRVIVDAVVQKVGNTRLLHHLHPTIVEHAAVVEAVAVIVVAVALVVVEAIAVEAAAADKGQLIPQGESQRL